MVFFSEIVDLMFVEHIVHKPVKQKEQNSKCEGLESPKPLSKSTVCSGKWRNNPVALQCDDLCAWN